MSSDVYAFILMIEDLVVDVFSLNINSSPDIKVPVVSPIIISSATLLPPFSAKYPVAPLTRPLTLVPATAFVVFVIFNIV